MASRHYSSHSLYIHDCTDVYIDIVDVQNLLNSRLGTILLPVIETKRADRLLKDIK